MRTWFTKGGKKVIIGRKSKRIREERKQYEILNSPYYCQECKRMYCKKHVHNWYHKVNPQYKFCSGCKPK